METILIVPGLGDSGPDHWQSWLQARLHNSLRVVQPDWHSPNLGVWRRTVRQAVRLVRGRVYMVAHSFGCLAAVCVAADRPGRIAGMMLVAPAEPRKFDVEHLLPDTPLGCPSVVVASSNDPWLQLSRAEYWSQRWGSRLCNLGAAGHINAEAGFGPWPQGADMLRVMQHSACPVDGSDPLNQPSRAQAPLATSGYVERWLGISRAYFAQDLREASAQDTPLALIGLAHRAPAASNSTQGKARNRYALKAFRF